MWCTFCMTASLVELYLHVIPSDTVGAGLPCLLSVKSAAGTKDAVREIKMPFFLHGIDGSA